MINPPKFVAVVPLRADAPNLAAFTGEKTAAQQRKVYPKLKPLEFNQSQIELVAATTKAIENLG